MPDPDAQRPEDGIGRAGQEAEGSRPSSLGFEGGQGVDGGEAGPSGVGGKRDGVGGGRSVVIRLDQNEIQEYPVSPTTSVEQEDRELQQHGVGKRSVVHAQGWDAGQEAALVNVDSGPGDAERTSTEEVLLCPADGDQEEDLESRVLQPQTPRSGHAHSMAMVGSVVECGVHVDDVEPGERGRGQSLRRGSIKRSRQEMSPDHGEGHDGENGGERRESSGGSERLRTVTFTQPGSDETSPRSCISSGRLRTLSDTLAPRNMPYLDSGEDWESEEDARSSRSGRNSSVHRGRARLSHTTWDSEEGTDSEREASTSPLRPSSGSPTSMTAQVE